MAAGVASASLSYSIEEFPKCCLENPTLEIPSGQSLTLTYLPPHLVKEFTKNPSEFVFWQLLNRILEVVSKRLVGRSLESRVSSLNFSVKERALTFCNPLEIAYPLHTEASSLRATLFSIVTLAARLKPGEAFVLDPGQGIVFLDARPHHVEEFNKALRDYRGDATKFMSALEAFIRAELADKKIQGVTFQIYTEIEGTHREKERCGLEIYFPSTLTSVLALHPTRPTDFLYIKAVFAEDYKEKKEGYFYPPALCHSTEFGKIAMSGKACSLLEFIAIFRKGALFGIAPSSSFLLTGLGTSHLLAIANMTSLVPIFNAVLEAFGLYVHRTAGTESMTCKVDIEKRILQICAAESPLLFEVRKIPQCLTSEEIQVWVSRKEGDFDLPSGQALELQIDPSAFDDINAKRVDSEPSIEDYDKALQSYPFLYTGSKKRKTQVVKLSVALRHPKAGDLLSYSLRESLLGTQRQCWMVITPGLTSAVSLKKEALA